MPKRFTATEKWVDPWFCELDPLNKLFWIYLLDNCDHAGMWQVNWPLVRFHLGNFVFDDKLFRDRIIALSDNKWHIPKFIAFQYGELNPDNRAHASVIKILEKEGASKGLNRGLIAPMDMVKDKVKEKTTQVIINNTINSPLFDDPEARELWDSWLEVRKQKKVPNTPAALKLALKKLEAWGTVKAKEALRNAIEKGWRGIFEPTTGNARKVNFVN